MWSSPLPHQEYTNETVLTEHLLNTSKGPQIAKTTRKIPAQPGRMKERKKKGMRWTLHPWMGNWRTGEGPTLREASSQAGRPAGTQGALETWRRALHLVSGRQNRVRPTRVVCAIQMAEKAHDKMLNIMNYLRNANENYTQVLPHSSQNGHHQHNL